MPESIIHYGNCAYTVNVTKVMFEGWEESVHQFNLWLTGFSHSSKQQSPEILRSGGQDDLPQHGVSDEQERKYFTLCAGK